MLAPRISYQFSFCVVFLQFLSVAGNKFIGKLPVLYASLLQLRVLNASDNQLTGEFTAVPVITHVGVCSTLLHCHLSYTPSWQHVDASLVG